jgi:MurNAc alpha-1-phosphate uridylyltransferase
MKAMILAAGRGERMRPLTDTTPKPLLIAGGKPIIQHTIEQLVRSGYTELVINTAHLGQQIRQSLGNGQQFGASIVYSDEGKTGLETAGGIIKALPILGKEPFLVVNGDIANDYNYSQLRNKPCDLAHLVLIPNPEHHPKGDFYLSSNGLVLTKGSPTLTFSGIGVYNPELFSETTPGKVKLAPLLKQAMSLNRVSGEKYNGFWMDIGTPQRLKELDDHYQR